jgi:hypothetical protein
LEHLLYVFSGFYSISKHRAQASPATSPCSGCTFCMVLFLPH